MSVDSVDVQSRDATGIGKVIVSLGTDVTGEQAKALTSTSASSLNVECSGTSTTLTVDKITQTDILLRISARFTGIISTDITMSVWAATPPTQLASEFL